MAWLGNLAEKEGVEIYTGFSAERLLVEGKTVHQVGLPFNYGWLHPKDGGDSTNFLTPTVGDANTFCPEYKAFMVNVTKL